jgi:hypothetical protein
VKKGRSPNYNRHLVFQGTLDFLRLPLVQENFLSTPSCLANPQDLHVKKCRSFYLNQSIARISTAKGLGHEMNYGLTALLGRKFKNEVSSSSSSSDTFIYLLKEFAVAYSKNYPKSCP